MKQKILNFVGAAAEKNFTHAGIIFKSDILAIVRIPLHGVGI